MPKLINLINKIKIFSIFPFMSLEERFQWIYKTRYWNSSESKSGDGSGLEATRGIRSELPLLTRSYSIRSILDVPCGDFYWMERLINDLEVRYIGGDIVNELISDLNFRHAKEGVIFKRIDIRVDALPESDLLLCRDCLFHLSNNDIHAFFENLARSKVRYLLTSSHMTTRSHKNIDIISGDFRLLNLFSTPFSLPPNYLYSFDDTTPGQHPRRMFLWEVTETFKNYAG